MSDAVTQKKALRAKYLSARAQMDENEKKAADGAIFDTFLAHSAFRDADLLLLFYPVRGEVDLLPLWDAARARGIPVALPRCEGKEMTFHVVGCPSELSIERFSIPAPSADAPVAKASERTLCILPGLAADKSGARLGYGGGFYDRFLATFRGITLFPVYERFVVAQLPTEETDKTVDVIVTEKGVLARHA